jgi:hypothetical protein
MGGRKRPTTSTLRATNSFLLKKFSDEGSLHDLHENWNA